MLTCTACGGKFGGEKVFSMHRVGKFPHASPEHPVPVGVAAKMRRCLSTEEMLQIGLHQDGKGKWAQSFGNAKRLRLAASKKRIAA